MCYEGNMNQQRLIEFLKRLIHDADKKVLFIVDNLRVRHGKIIRQWLSEHRNEIEVFHISPDSPEINPDEYLNHSGKLPDGKRIRSQNPQFYVKASEEPSESPQAV